jgi:hypothetical protein
MNAIEFKNVTKSFKDGDEIIEAFEAIKNDKDLIAKLKQIRKINNTSDCYGS